MSDANAYNQVVEEYAAIAEEVIGQRITGMVKQPASPIERAFLIGLIGLSWTTPCYDFHDSFSGIVLNRASVLPIISVTLQAPVENYRADFLLTVLHKGDVIGRVVVECDGHAFHERTKEQAAHDRSRDRAMTLAGYTVMRFTGSEIHRNLMSCVMDAHNAAWQHYDKLAVK